MEQAALYNMANIVLPVSMALNQTFVNTRISSFSCPSSRLEGPIDLGRLSPDLGSGNFKHGGLESAPASQYVASSGYVDLKTGFSSPTPQHAAGDGVFFMDSQISTSDILDGTSNTLMAGERSRSVADAMWSSIIGIEVPVCTKSGWTVSACVSGMFLTLGRTGLSSDLMGGTAGSSVPNAAEAGPDGFGSSHPGLCNFLYCDGSVRPVKSTISAPVFRALGSRAGSEVMSTSDW